MPEKEPEQVHTITAIARKHPSSGIQVRTIPVILRSGDQETEVMACLDDCSTQTLIHKDVAARIGMTGPVSKTALQVAGGVVIMQNSMQVKCELQDVQRTMKQTIQAQSVDTISHHLEGYDWNREKRNWGHIQSINFPKVRRPYQVELLIGLDHPALHESFGEIRGRSDKEPFARLTPLGWTCIGTPKRQCENQYNHASRCFLTRAIDVDYLEELDKTIKRFWEIEESGTVQFSNGLSPENEEIKTKTIEALKCNDNQYEVEIPWKIVPRQTLESRRMAEKRLINLEKVLLRGKLEDGSYKGKYTYFVDANCGIYITVNTVNSSATW